MLPCIIISFNLFNDLSEKHNIEKAYVYGKRIDNSNLAELQLCYNDYTSKYIKVPYSSILLVKDNSPTNIISAMWEYFNLRARRGIITNEFSENRNAKHVRKQFQSLLKRTTKYP